MTRHGRFKLRQQQGCCPRREREKERGREREREWVSGFRTVDRACESDRARGVYTKANAASERADAAKGIISRESDQRVQMTRP